jgi:3-oxoacyl-[acyl-carrier-protein] synthase II
MGYADRMLAGGSEACIDPLSIAGFARLRALATSKDPLTASRPFDRDRNGFVMGEGACILVLEELEVALKRCAPIIAEVVGYGMSSDAFQPTLPLPSGDGAIRSMKMALADAGILKRNDGGLVAATEMDQCSLGQLSRVGYINAHATSTQQGDAIEAQAVQTTFAQRLQNAPPLYISSTKGATGHLLGAAGALEIAFTALALRDGTLPPTINLDNALSLDAVAPAFQHSNLCIAAARHCVALGFQSH